MFMRQIRSGLFSKGMLLAMLVCGGTAFINQGVFADETPKTVKDAKAAVDKAADKAKDAAAEKPAAKVDINKATAEELEELPGIGEATSKKIIAGRPYKSVDELSKAGLSEAKIAKLASLVTVSGKAGHETSAKPLPAKVEAKAGKVDLNSATAEELEELPGVGPATSAKIIAARPLTSVDELSKAGLTPAKIAKLESLVSVGKAATSIKPAVVGTTVVGTEKPKTTTVVDPKATKPADDKVKPVPTATKIDLNNASEKELETLDGVGKATAAKIIKGRPYAKIEDVIKAGVTQSTYNKFKDNVTVAEAKGETAKKPADDKMEKTPGKGSGKVVAGRDKPNKGDVWVNTDSGIYHKEGDRYFGNTKVGKYMTEEEAKAAGHRESK